MLRGPSLFHFILPPAALQCTIFQIRLMLNKSAKLSRFGASGLGCLVQTAKRKPLLRPAGPPAADVHPGRSAGRRQVPCALFFRRSPWLYAAGEIYAQERTAKFTQSALYAPFLFSFFYSACGPFFWGRSFSFCPIFPQRCARRFFPANSPAATSTRATATANAAHSQNAPSSPPWAWACAAAAPLTKSV